MHIPDGFISPKLYLPAYGVAGGLWVVGLRRARRLLSAEVVPALGVLTAVAFVLSSLAIPIPGGTTAHASGVALLAVTFGAWPSFLSVSVVLVLQALLLGAGGITSLPVNAIAVGCVGSAVAVGSFGALRRVNETAALAAAGWSSVVAPAAVVALALGLQPAIAHRPDGTPLFFPFDLTITFLAVLVPHALIGVGEAVLTVAAYRFLARYVRVDDPSAEGES